MPRLAPDLRARFPDVLPIANQVGLERGKIDEHERVAQPADDPSRALEVHAQLLHARLGGDVHRVDRRLPDHPVVGQPMMRLEIS